MTSAPGIAHTAHSPVIEYVALSLAVKKRRESDDKNAVAFVKIVPQLGCVSQDSDALVSQRGKESRGKPTQKVLGSIQKNMVHSVHATSGKYMGKERTIA